MGILLCNVLVIVLLMGTGCTKENASVIHGVKEFKQNEISVKIKTWQSEGFVGTVVTGNEKIKKGENVTVIFDDNVLVLNSNGSKFEYNSEMPNAEECGIKNGITVMITYSAYELAIEDVNTTIYAEKITE